MAKTDFKTIDEYEKTFDGEALKRLKIIRDLVHKIAPQAQEVISYQIPAFKLAEKRFMIYYCAFPKHLTLSSPWSAAFLKTFEEDLSELKISKSAIQFPHDQPLPINLIKRILKFRKVEAEK